MGRLNTKLRTILGTASPKASEVRSPGTAQASEINAFNLHLNRASHFRQFDHVSGGVLFDTPEEDAAKAAAAEQAIIDKAVTQAVEKTTAALDAKYKKQIDGLSKAVAAYSKKAKETEVIEGDPTEGDPADGDPKNRPAPKKSAEMKAMEAKLAALETKDKEREARALKTAKDAALETLANKIGIDPDRMEDFFLHIDKHHGSKIVLDDGSNAVVYRASEEDEAIPIADWLKQMDAEKKWNKYKPAPHTPKKGPNNAANDGGGNGTGKTMTKAEYKQAMIDGVQGLDKVTLLSDV